MWDSLIFPGLRLVSHLYFLFVHVAFWLFNTLFRVRIVVPRPPDEDLNQLLLISATQAAEMIRRREVYIRRICAVNPAINAVVQKNFDDAIKEAERIDYWFSSVSAQSEEVTSLATRKPLLGVPFTVKDALRVRGLRSVCGVPALATAPANEHDAAVIARMRDAGAIPLAVTNVPEACMWYQTYNGIYGRTASPFDSRKGVGGSCGGEAALISAAGSVIGVGSDIGGSIRMPSFFNGIFGLKPTPGLIPVRGHLPDDFKGESALMFSIGPMCRYARDLTAMLKVMVGPEVSARLNLDKPPKLRHARIFYMNGLDSLLCSPVHTDCLRAVENTVCYFETKYDLTAYNIRLPITQHAMSMWMVGMHTPEVRFADQLAGFKKDSNFNPFLELFWLLLGKSQHTLPVLLQAILDDLPERLWPNRDFVLSKRDQLRREVQNLLGADGILIMPGMPRPSYFHGESLFCPFECQYPSLWNVVGVPVLSCPLGLNAEGTPVGVQVVAGIEADALLIAVAQDLEEGFGGWKAPIRG